MMKMGWYELLAFEMYQHWDFYYENDIESGIFTKQALIWRKREDNVFSSSKELMNTNIYWLVLK